MTNPTLPPWARMSRRGVLRAGVGGTAAILFTRASVLDAVAQGRGDGGGYAFFNANDARTVEAITERLWPGGETPGAVEIGVPNYIDQAMVSAYQDRQLAYHEGLRKLDGASQEIHGGVFSQLDEGQQDEILTRLQDDDLPGFDTGEAAEFFNMVHGHTMQGLFADPIYGGNRDFEGWRQVGYPGPFLIISEEQQQSFEPLDLPLQSIVDL